MVMRTCNISVFMAKNLAQWSMRFEGEVKAIALGAAWVDVVTSFNYLCIFIDGGLQVCCNLIAYLLFPFSIIKYWRLDTSLNLKELGV